MSLDFEIRPKSWNLLANEVIEEAKRAKSSNHSQAPDSRAQVTHKT
jgi:hypothetical protein